MAPTLSSLLDPSRIRVGLRAETKTDLLFQLVALVATSDAVDDAPGLLEAVEAREALISTGVGDGLAFPHARTESVTRTVASFATLAEPVEFEALDGQPVRLVLLIAGAEGERRGHVRLLSRVSRVLADTALRQRLLGAQTPAEILDALTEAEASLAEG